jgi:hypothetical protein
MLPHVDRFLPVHNLDSLEHLVRLLGEPDRPLRAAAAMYGGAALPA